MFSLAMLQLFSAKSGSSIDARHMIFASCIDRSWLLLWCSYIPDENGEKWREVYASWGSLCLSGSLWLSRMILMCNVRVRSYIFDENDGCPLNKSLLFYI